MSQVRLSSPATEQDSSSPRSVLRRDRTALLVTVSSVVLITAALPDVFPDVLTYVPIIGLGVDAAVVGSVGVNVVVLVLFGSGSAWLSYYRPVMARLDRSAALAADEIPA